MLIKIYDGNATNPGDVSWGKILDLGKVVVYDKCTREQFLERISDVEIAITNKQTWDAEAFDHAPKLKMIALCSTGYNLVDLEAAAAHGVVVSNAPSYSTPDVAQHTFALLLELTNHVGDLNRRVQAGDWIHAGDFNFWGETLIEVADKTFGIIGMGHIGQAVAKIARGFGCQVIFADRRPKPELESDGIKQVERDDLFKQADIISLHCALTEETTGMINEQSLALMKDGVYIINCARGPLIDEKALRAALDSGKVRGAGLDVLDHEPMAPDCPLLGAPHCVITPHMAWATVEARTRLYKIIAENIEAFLAGHPINVVDPAVLKKS